VTGHNEDVDSKCRHFSAIGCFELITFIQTFTLFQLFVPPHKYTYDDGGGGCDETLPETYST